VTVEEVKEYINRQVNEHGYFVNAYLLPHAVGKIHPVAVNKGVGNALILDVATPEEFERVSGFPAPTHLPYLYKMMID